MRAPDSTNTPLTYKLLCIVLAVITRVGIKVPESETKVNLAGFSVLLAIAAGVVLKGTMVTKRAFGEKFLRCGGNWLIVNVVQKVQVDSRGAEALLLLQKKGK